MEHYEFKKTEYDEDMHETASVSMVFTETDLDEIVMYFEEFLRGSGFMFKGNLMIVDEDDKVLSDLRETPQCCGKCGGND